MMARILMQMAALTLIMTGLPAVASESDFVRNLRNVEIAAFSLHCPSFGRVEPARVREIKAEIDHTGYQKIADLVQRVDDRFKKEGRDAVCRAYLAKYGPAGSARPGEISPN